MTPFYWRSAQVNGVFRVETTITDSIRVEYADLSQNAVDDPRDVQSICNEVINLECFERTDDPNWDGKGTMINGKIDDKFNGSGLKSQLPEGVTLDIVNSGLFG